MFETQYLYLIIIFGVLVLISFILIPILFSIKDLKRTKLLHFEDNGKLVLEDDLASRYFSSAEIQENTLRIISKEEHDFDITIVASYGKKKSVKNYRFHAKKDDILTVSLKSRATTVGFLFNFVDNKVVSKVNRFTRIKSLVISYLIASAVLAACVFVYSLIEQSAFYQDPMITVFYVMSASGLVAGIVAFFITLVFDRKVRI